MVFHLLVPVILAASPAAGFSGKSIAFVGLQARQGVSEDQAQLVADAILAELRARRVFSHVTAMAELKQALSFEQQKQLLDCGEASCTAEVAGALGVDFLLVGNLGMLGEVHMLSLAVVDARSGAGVHAVSRAVDGGATALARAATGAVDELLGVPATAPAPEARDELATGGPGEPAAPPGRSPLRRSLLGAGLAGVGLAIGTLDAVIIVGLGVAAVGLYAAVASVQGPGRYYDNLQLVFTGMQVVTVAAVLGLPVSLLITVGGVALAVVLAFVG